LEVGTDRPVDVGALLAQIDQLRSGAADSSGFDQEYRVGDAALLRRCPGPRSRT
jgi:hypothetical protein